MNSEVIEVKDLTKNYGKLQVLDKINFTVKKGEFVSIIGPSGCGKTTLLKILAGLRLPSEGAIKVYGKFGFVFQDPTLLPWRTSLKNIELPLEIFGHNNSSRSSEELLRLVGLTGFENFYPKQLSGGMQQRVAIARALIFNPAILLMDEPFGALDEITRNRMNLELLRILGQERKTISAVIFVTHSIAEAVFLSDRVIVLSKRPSRLEKIIKINLARPRKTEMKRSKNYLAHVECLRKTLKAD